MHKFYTIFSLFIISFLYADIVSAKESPFIIVESHKRKISKNTLDSIESTKAINGISVLANALIMTDSSTSVVVTTGPEDDMLSFRIHGLRNPRFVMRAGSKLHILFINTDGDMQHDMRIGTDKPPFPISPNTEAIGTSKQMPEQTGMFSGEDIVVRALESGEYTYYCSVRGHAKGGMWGKITVIDSNVSSDQILKLGVDTSDNSMKGMKGNEGMDMNMNMDGMDMTGMGGMQGMVGMKMNGSVLVSVPMSQEGSGTSWHPESSPLYAAMFQNGDWMSMLHGHISIRYDHQGSIRGGNDFDAPNYVMGMTQRMLGASSQIMFRSMLSLDWLTEGGNGYPLLLQTGETWHGQHLVDRQHPHDLFAELATAISTEFSKSLSGYLYLGYPGEPAIGPPAFMHRLSAMSDPDAPISHHWQDASHITFGVATAGIKFDQFKIEGSVFTGSEPDENRVNFDKPHFDSYSGRISYNPTSEIALQFSRGFFKNPEGDFSNEWLSTASGIYTHVFGAEKWISNTLVWSSKKDHHTPAEQTSVLLESEFHLDANAIYGRFEYVEKPQIEMGLAFAPSFGSEKEPVKELTFGINRRIFQTYGVDIDLGVQGTINFIPENIAFVYQDQYPKAFEIYIALHPKIYGGM